MKLFFDENLSEKLPLHLAVEFPNSSHPRLCGMAGATDRSQMTFGGGTENLTRSGISTSRVTMTLRHTASHGFRTYDLLHISLALLLGCDTFWTFDPKASHLANLEGLTTI